MHQITKHAARISWIFSLVVFFASCDTLVEKKMTQDEFGKEIHEVNLVDSILVKAKNDCVIKLGSKKYSLQSTLVLEGIKNLKIQGDVDTELFLQDKNGTTIELINCENVTLENIVIGHKGGNRFFGDPGAVRIFNSKSIAMDHCTILGGGTFGLVTKKIKDFYFVNSEITACTALIFELENSTNCNFSYSKFRNNNLGVSVLGGFTNETQKVTFSNCEFSNNIPSQLGNPAFNFYENYEKGTDKVLFENCIFKYNPGYKWYGEKIELVNCQIDSSDFVGFGSN